MVDPRPPSRTTPLRSRPSALGPEALLPWLLLVALVSVTPTSAQVVRGAPDTTSVVVDSSDALSVARAAQARFERRRVRLLPTSYGSFGGSCDEVVGRICVTFGEGEWYPRPEDPEIVMARRALLAELDSLQALLPGDAWILGQRVWYRAEADDWGRALTTAARCGLAEDERWWCHALEGFALHGMGRYRQAEAAFEAALAGVDRERARRWAVPRWPVDGDARELLEDAIETERASLLDRLWALADPLWLVPGNDRRTAHLARWTASEIRDGARNPFRLPWGDDLTELTVRHGWQEGWERIPARSPTYDDQVVGHDHPLGRDYMPPGEVLRDPSTADAEALRPRVRRPRSLYAPEYAPVLLPMEAQVAVFPRGAGVVVATSHFLPADTTFHSDHGHPLPWLDPGAQVGLSDRIGLFALAVGEEREGGERDPRPRPAEGVLGSRRPAGDEPHRVLGPPARGLRILGVQRAGSTDEPPMLGVQQAGSPDGALLLDLPEGDYVISAESWSPPRRRAGRLRMGVEARPAVPDVAGLSDIVLLRPGSTEPETLEEALESLLPDLRIAPGQAFAVGWEVSGLGFRPESLDFELSVERSDRDVFHRIGDFLGLSDPPRPLGLSWEEPGPDRPGHLFRYLELDVPALEEGEYEIRLVLRTAGRSDVVATRRFEVVDGS